MIGMITLSKKNYIASPVWYCYNNGGIMLNSSLSAIGIYKGSLGYTG